MNNSNPAQFKINIKELQQFQDIISSVTNLFMFCVGSDGNRITEMSGDPLETKRILGLVDENQIISVIGRVLGTSLEEQVIEDTAYPNVKIASIGVRMGSIPAFCWFVCGVLDNEDGENAVLNIHTVTSEANFNKSVDLIREASSKLYSLAPESPKSDKSSSDIDTDDIMKAYRKSQSMAEIISLLDSDDSFDAISQRIINFASKYAGITHAYMLRLITDDKVELMAQYEKEGVFSLDREFEDIPLDILHSLGDRPTVISYKTQIESSQRRWLDVMSLSAMIVMPILYNHKPTMYLFFADTDSSKEWSIDDTKFFGDAVRVLRNIMARRLQKNSITSSYKSLEAILDNVGSAIYVRDTESGNILFANRMCKSTFMQEMRNGTLEKLFEKSYYITNRRCP